MRPCMRPLTPAVSCPYTQLVSKAFSTAAEVLVASVPPWARNIRDLCREREGNHFQCFFWIDRWYAGLEELGNFDKQGTIAWRPRSRTWHNFLAEQANPIIIRALTDSPHHTYAAPFKRGYR